MSTPPPLPERPRLPWDPPDHFEKRVPDGDNRERLVCARCEFIHYQNPKIVAGAVCTWGDKILLAKRAIEPRKGFWTLPAGYMELGETTEQAAEREAREEACASIEIDRLLAMYSVARIGQVQIMYRAKLLSADIAPGVESEAVALLDWAERAVAGVLTEQPGEHEATDHCRRHRQNDEDGRRQAKRDDVAERDPQAQQRDRPAQQLLDAEGQAGLERRPHCH